MAASRGSVSDGRVQTPVAHAPGSPEDRRISCKSRPPNQGQPRGTLAVPSLALQCCSKNSRVLSRLHITPCNPFTRRSRSLRRYFKHACRSASLGSRPSVDQEQLPRCGCRSSLISGDAGDVALVVGDFLATMRGWLARLSTCRTEALPSRSQSHCTAGVALRPAELFEHEGHEVVPRREGDLHRRQLSPASGRYFMSIFSVVPVAWLRASTSTSAGSRR